MSKKVLVSTLLVSVLTLGAMSSVNAAPSAGAPMEDPHVDVSKITNTLTASKQTKLHAGDEVRWTATTVFDNVWAGPIPPLPYNSNFVVAINKIHFPNQPVITARTLPTSCANAEFVDNQGVEWRFTCGPKLFWQGDTWSIQFTTVAGGRDLGRRMTNVLTQTTPTHGTPATVVTGGN